MKMGRKITVASCSLNQWALDFDGNCSRIIESIKQAKKQGASYRVGPELEITGYGCADHFLEVDTCRHSFEVLAKIMVDRDCQDIVCDVGMPVLHNNNLYNCRVIFYNKKIVLIRPKLTLCNDGNYRELRWFNPWTKLKQFEDHALPEIIQDIAKQKIVPFGDCIISTLDTSIGFETCEEMFVPSSPLNSMSLDNVEIILNSSGSHHQLRKANLRVEAIKEATNKCGGLYLYSNFFGCDSDRLYYDGCSSICMNGQFLAQGPQFSLEQVLTISATADLDEVGIYRNRRKSFSLKAEHEGHYPRIELPVSLCHKQNRVLTDPIDWQYHSAEEEISLGPACWLWDYLRRSGQNGYFLPLSGGIDSSSVACIVSSMCRLVFKAVKEGNAQVIRDMRQIVGDDKYMPTNHQDLANHLFTTCYMGSENSSEETKSRAKELAKQVGSYHMDISIQTLVSALLALFISVMGVTPKFKKFGGSVRENQALQNIQARLRMVLAYFFAQLTLWARGRPGSLLVLGSANVDESLRGYMTKYDCSSADLNPIGGISKTDLKKFILYCIKEFDLSSLQNIYGAPPTAELEPLEDGQITQTDEEDMGMTYDELSVYGRLRQIDRCGPYSMFCKLIHLWKPKDTDTETHNKTIAEKVKHFFRCYAINRHKMTVLTPSYYAECYSPDDNRFDLRPFLYNAAWSWQFQKIDAMVYELDTYDQMQL